jgi:hypothetical protein
MLSLRKNITSLTAMDVGETLSPAAGRFVESRPAPIAGEVDHLRI